MCSSPVWKLAYIEERGVSPSADREGRSSDSPQQRRPTSVLHPPYIQTWGETTICSRNQLCPRVLARLELIRHSKLTSMYSTPRRDAATPPLDSADSTPGPSRHAA